MEENICKSYIRLGYRHEYKELLWLKKTQTIKKQPNLKIGKGLE